MDNKRTIMLLNDNYNYKSATNESIWCHIKPSKLVQYFEVVVRQPLKKVTVQ